jgi:phage shock protein C
MQAKKLYRSRTDRMLAGIFGGMGEYFSVDPTLLRLGWVVVTILSAVIPGVAIYLVAMVLVPLEPASAHKPTDAAPPSSGLFSGGSAESKEHDASQSSPSKSPADDAPESGRSW